MLLAEFDLAVDYGQIFVFRPSLPCILWTSRHSVPSGSGFSLLPEDAEKMI